MARRARVLFLSQCLPYPPHTGVAARTFNILLQLQQSYDVDLVAFYRTTHQPNRRALEASWAALRQVVGSVAEPTPIPGEHSLVRRLWDHGRSLVTGRAYTFFEYDSRAFARRLRRVLRARTPDIVHLDSLDLHRWLPELPGVPITCTHHDIDSDLLRRVTATRSRGTTVFPASGRSHRATGARALRAIRGERDDVGSGCPETPRAGTGRCDGGGPQRHRHRLFPAALLRGHWKARHLRGPHALQLPQSRCRRIPPRRDLAPGSRRGRDDLVAVDRSPCPGGPCALPRPAARGGIGSGSRHSTDARRGRLLRRPDTYRRRNAPQDPRRLGDGKGDRLDVDRVRRAQCSRRGQHPHPRHARRVCRSRRADPRRRRAAAATRAKRPPHGSRALQLDHGGKAVA